MNKTNSLLLAGVLSATLMTSLNVRAEEAAAAAPAAEPASPHTLTANVGFYSDYVFRGLGYAKNGAIQGGMDYSHASGFFAGVWGSNVNDYQIGGLQDPTVAGAKNNNLEIDLYAGYIRELAKDLTMNVGVLQFIYPHNAKNSSGKAADTTELNAALTYKFATVKANYQVSDSYGLPNSDGSYYLEAGIVYPVAQMPGLNLTARIGNMKYVSPYSPLDYTDWGIGVNKDFAIASSTGWNASLSYSSTDADSKLYTIDGTNQGKDKVLFSLKRTF